MCIHVWVSKGNGKDYVCEKCGREMSPVEKMKMGLI